MTWRKREIMDMARESHMDVYGLAKDHEKFVAALEAFAKLVREDEREACAKVCEDLRKKEIAHWNAYGMDGSYYSTGDCATAIRARLAQPEQEPEPPSDENIFDAWVSASDSDGISYDGPSFERGYRLGRGEYDEYTGALVADAIKQAQPEQEPLVWAALIDENQRLRAELKFNTPPAQPAQRTEQEPLDYEKLAALGWQAIECGICGGGAMGYPQRTWVGLTNKERYQATQTVNYLALAMTHSEWVEAVQIETEAKLKEKNT